jgi:hypothetical protein
MRFCKPSTEHPMTCEVCGWTWTRLDISATFPVKICRLPLTRKQKAEQRKQMHQRLKQGGAGDQLHLLIILCFGEDFIAGCECLAYAAKMDAWGPEGCRKRIDRIVHKLLTEARKRGMLKTKIRRWAAPKVARLMIRWAIRRAEKRLCRQTRLNASVVRSGV